jgi:Fe-S-cluster-containing dehydrogenase component/DMSO reductase anchor subunit
VERFEQFHREMVEPLQGRYYSALLPAVPPGPGQQLAFEVDLERCSGCKACVAACHALNGLDEGESWRDVGLLVGGTAALPVIQHVTTACHHCLEPACLTACPVDAYEKDPSTGIVKHLDDQCIGCKYCTLACPYDVPRYHPGKGIVRKCDMCGDRLRAGEAPACVQACPHEAIRIRVVDNDEAHIQAEVGTFLPDAFDPSYTLPTTRYRSLPTAGLRRADVGHPMPEQGHTPLVLMLVLTQLSAGGFLIELVACLAGRPDGAAGQIYPQLCLGLGFLGLVASLFHLGRPMYAYRAVIGLRHSWLSREVVALGLFALLATFYVAAVAVAPVWLAALPTLRAGLLATVVMAGAAMVSSSVMVYHVVRRPFWRASSAGWKFAGTALLLGLAAALACLGIAVIGGPAKSGEWDSGWASALALALAVVFVAKFRLEARDYRGEGSQSSVGPTAGLLHGPLKRVVRYRTFLGLAGGVVLPLLVVLGAFSRSPAAAPVALLTFAAAVGGELLERYMFFTAAARPSMPGGLPS